MNSYYSVVVAALALGICVVPASSVQYAWVGGPTTIRDTGAYGTKGVANTSYLPHSRYAPAFWFDEETREAWVFGGAAYLTPAGGDKFFNDLWKYKIDDRSWTWVGGDQSHNQPGRYGVRGVPSASNWPGSRSAGAAWFDARKKEVWIFGGHGYAASNSYGNLNLLWKYRMADGIWTWVNGSSTVDSVGVYGTKDVASASNSPSSRTNPSAWYDHNLGRLWLFGGYGGSTNTAEGFLDDLWLFDLSMQMWTWVAGANSINSPGVLANTINTVGSPRSRVAAVAWIDNSSGDLWLFGGLARFGNGDLNDFWKFEPTNRRWIWLGGSQFFNGTAVYGTKGLAMVGNVPTPRYDAFVWEDGDDIWLFSGIKNSEVEFLSDLWRFGKRDSTWAWISGPLESNVVASHGTIGVFSVLNRPGARGGSAGWFDSTSREAIVFGGRGLSASTTMGDLNDIWRIAVSASPAQEPPRLVPSAVPAPAGVVLGEAPVIQEALTNGSLATGAVVGIIVGIIFVLVLIGAILFFALRRRKGPGSDSSHEAMRPHLKRDSMQEKSPQPQPQQAVIKLKSDAEFGPSGSYSLPINDSYNKTL